VARGVAIGTMCGIVWGVVAAAVFTAMRAHLLPTPSEVAFPVALVLVLAYLPFNVAIGVAVLLRLSAQSFVDIIGATIACGAAMGVAGSLLVARARGGAQR
jgi:ABC-type lipoprotein release transport system permease subunit